MVTIRKNSGDNLQKFRLQFTKNTVTSYNFKATMKNGRLQFTKNKVTIYNKYGYKCAGKDEKLIMVDRMMV
jgi:hypothetical protein